MKKVRLFAVAAAMGMFAATVNAAAPVVTKEAYSATWGTMEEIVRAEIGGKIVLPTANLTVTKQTRSTDPELATKDGGLFGGSLSNTCYVGLTNTVGKDTNGDGLTDYAVLSWGNEAQNGGDADDSIRKASTDGWYYDDYKFFPTINTTLFYLGMTNDGIGARFIAPNAAAEKGWIISTSHTKYATEADVLAALEAAGKVQLVEDSRGDVTVINVNTKEYTTTVAGKTVKLGKAWKEYKAANTRYGVDELAEFVVSKFDGTTSTVVGVAEAYKAVMYYTSTNTVAPVYSAILPNDTSTGDLDGKILVVEENRYGEIVVVEVDADDTIAAAGGLPAINGEAGKVVVALKDGSNYSKYMTITPKAATSGAEFEMIWDYETGTFAKKEIVKTLADGVWTGAVAATISAEVDIVSHKSAGGLYKYDNPKNTTDRIVVNFNMGEYPWMLNVSGINTSKGTITLVDAFDKELTTSAVKLDGKWYPTVADRTELQEFVRRMAGIKTASQAFVNELAAKKVYSTITWVDGTKDTEYVPANPLAHYKAQQCTYVSAETAVDAASVVVTSDVDAVDTSKYGVHAVKLTAKVGDTVVGTKDIKVVIAPKYVREYKNGKVTSLKAYHLNGNLYSHTTFDYAKKTSTAVFYAQDGVTAVETVTSAIK